MVLHELHVAQRHAVAVGHGHAVTGDDARIGVEAKQPPRPAGGQHHRLGTQQQQLTRGDLQSNDAHHGPFVHGQVQYEVLVEAFDLGVFQRGLKQRVQHMEAGLVGSKPGARGFHTTKAAHLYAAIGLAAPGAAPALHLHQLLVGVAHEVVHHALLHQPVTPGNRVVEVRLKRVLVTGHRRRAPFGRHRVGTHGIHLGDQRNALRVTALLGLLGGRDGGPQASAPTADDDDIHILLLHGTPLCGCTTHDAILITDFS